MPRPSALWGILTLVCALFASACDLNKFHLGGDRQDADLGDGGDNGDGGGGVDAETDAPTDAAVDACVAVTERCDLMDNDCDGMTDETFDTTADPRHCGGCNMPCNQPNTAGTCANSTCSFTCLPGWVDRDNDPSNGCDYFCTPTNNGVEACDLVDNDCDTRTDEGLMLETDVNNCGTCGNVCRALHATPTCSNSMCGHGACDDGFADIVPAIAGCEYTCPVFPTRAETCDNIDEDCDGRTDEGTLAGVGDMCHPDPGLGGVGVCTRGTTVCSFGVIACQGWVGPSSETCDNEDDDCDGAIDNGFDKMNDPRYCGGCTACNLPNAVEGCSMGSCTVTACLPGFVDEDGLPGNGCEYQCTPTGPEVCDGVDNDCDRDIDAADADLVLPPSNFCRQAGTCMGTTPTCGTDGCSTTITWQCAYGGATEDTCNDLPLQEQRCDGLDGDCDTRVDEAYPTLGDDCHDGGIGACRAFGEIACNAAGDGVECDTPTPPTPVAETCNNIDDDCDTLLDEGAPDTMVHVVNGPTDFYIYAYEASRPGSTLTDFGTAEHRSCSAPDRLPWRNVTQVQAAAACAAAGRRLCTEAEWQLGCEGVAGLEYPYGNTYDPDACNGRDNDPDCTGADDDKVVATGTRHGCPTPAVSQCISPYGAFDMSGNLREWTSTPVGASAFRVRGGAFDNVAQGLTCDLSFIALDPNFAFANLGFRCCSNTP